METLIVLAKLVLVFAVSGFAFWATMLCCNGTSYGIDLATCVATLTGFVALLGLFSKEI